MYDPTTVGVIPRTTAASPDVMKSRITITLEPIFSRLHLPLKD
jgi:hypothetical protein